MKIVALWGRGEVGKSTTLKMFLQQLLEKNDITANNHNSDGVITSEELKKELARENPQLIFSNFHVTNYTVTFKIGDKKYGLTTRGDDEWALKNDFDFFSDCDIVFCAARTKGGSVKFIKSKKLFIWVAKTYVSGKIENSDNLLKLINYTNEKQVEILFEIFKNL